eukprot:CAMPEP_0183328202 /NCGR_PEP_ID=MMETSP0160_2-20130417/84160_1 /TAXON_ID=2839 ORGANISM="Odontella Sinensis, Strain Grunow 1884" /NCGR_SAMPLE_ID=MMETSP0160_2 /ASSEMBLY_ACC=CAM_ASM_000250 /LENGTH=504 /DNA_ID=CAMNT_0025496361 /DNA_START=199 /DNA_END=1714 /DNA_ORIENTATION=-
MGYADKPARRKRTRAVLTDTAKPSSVPNDGGKKMLSRTDDTSNDVNTMMPPSQTSETISGRAAKTEDRPAEEGVATIDAGPAEGGASTGIRPLPVDDSAKKKKKNLGHSGLGLTEQRNRASDDGENDNYIPRPKCASLPRVLMALLDDESGANSKVMTWTPDGKAFAILDVEAFASGLMKERFKVARFDTFVRKLSSWGFEEMGLRATFCHPNFKRGDWDACRLQGGEVRNLRSEAGRVGLRRNNARRSLSGRRAGRSQNFPPSEFQEGRLGRVPADSVQQEEAVPCLRSFAAAAADFPFIRLTGAPTAAVSPDPSVVLGEHQEPHPLKRAGSASSLSLIQETAAVGRTSSKVGEDTAAHSVMGAALGVVMRDKMRNQQVRMKQWCAMQRQQLQLQMQRRSSLSMQGQMFDSKELQAKMMLQQQRHQTTAAHSVMGAALGVVMRDKMRNQQVRMKQWCAMQRQQLQMQMQRRSSGQMLDSGELQAKMMLQQQRHQTVRGFFAHR